MTVGAFGWEPEGGPRWTSAVDIDEALAWSEPLVRFWASVAAFPDTAQVFSGGIMDAWPAWAVDALSICREEREAIGRYLASLRKGKKVAG